MVGVKRTGFGASVRMKYGLIICGTVLLIIGVVLYITGQGVIIWTTDAAKRLVADTLAIPDPAQQALGAALGILGVVMLIIGMKTGES